MFNQTVSQIISPQIMAMYKAQAAVNAKNWETWMTIWAIALAVVIAIWIFGLVSRTILDYDGDINLWGILLVVTTALVLISCMICLTGYESYLLSRDFPDEWAYRKAVGVTSTVINSIK